MLAEYLEFVSAVKKPNLVRGDVSFRQSRHSFGSGNVL
jgi:hypothetical protein